MQESTHSLGTGTRPGHRAGVRRAALRAEHTGASLLVSPFVVLLLVGGILPTLYAIYQSFLNRSGRGFGGISAYSTIIGDFRFWPSFSHIGLTLLVWLPIMMVGVIGMALLLDSAGPRFSSLNRFIYYLPGALMGMANFVLWLFILDPAESPIRPLLHLFGFTTLRQVVSPGHLPVVLAAMLFFQGAGTWIVIVQGGLNGIPEEVLEAARLDGAGAGQLARFVKLPIIVPWIAYTALMNLAYGFQLFLEPQVLGLATQGSISPQWTPNQLSYTYAFSVNDLPAAAALAIILLVISLGIGLIIITRAGLFSTE